MNILLLGPQGSGKGTQARLLVDKFGLFYFEAGAFLRKLANKNENLKKSLSEGKLVPDSEMSSYVASYLDEKQTYDNIIFDGFPRTTTQYNFFKNWMSQKNVTVDLVFVLEVSDETAIKRLSGRGRDDDKPEVIKRRLAWYKQLVVPLISILKTDTKVEVVDGERSIEEIHKDLVKLINKRKND